MTGLLTPSKLELLTQQVVYEHSIITYRVAARMFKMGARDAKRCPEKSVKTAATDC
jgi:hypothetical protein